MRLTSSTSKYRDLSSCVLLIAAICVLEAKTPDQLSFGTL